MSAFASEIETQMRSSRGANCDPRTATMAVVIMLKNQIASAEDRREDPLVVPIDTVIGNHGIALTAAGNSRERAGRTCRVVFAAGRSVFGLVIEHIHHLRDHCSQCREVSARRGGHATAVNSQVANQSGKVPRGR